VGRLHLGLALENLEDNGGAAERNQEADEHGFADAQAGKSRQEKENQTGDRHLDRPADEHRAAQLQQIGKRKFDADGEQQQDDPDFRQDLDFVHRLDQTQNLGAGQHPGEDKPHDGGNPQAVADKDHHDGQGVNDEQIEDDGNFHGEISASAP
jgi:hypothetical protein